MSKYILVGGYVHKAEDGGKAFMEELVKGFNKPVKILDCVFADPEQAEEKFKQDQERFSKFISDFTLELATPEKFLEQLKECDAVFFRGGETDILIDTLNKCGDWVPLLQGKTVAGTSAGAMMLAKYSHALEQNKIMDGLGILPVKVIAHWQSDIYEVKWDEALTMLKEYKEDLPTYTLKEGDYIVIEK